MRHSSSFPVACREQAAASVDAFSQLRELERKQTTAILDELSNRSRIYNMRLIRRLRDLFDNASEEDPNDPPVSGSSLKDFAKFIKTRNDWT